jgi:hypothetical protein
MKRLYTLLITGILLMSGISAIQAQCLRIARDTTVITGSVDLTITSEYIYDVSNKLVSIERSVYGMVYYKDSIYYNSISGKVDSLIRYDGSSGGLTSDFLKNTWVGGNLTRQVNHYSLLGPVNKDTSDYTYSGSSLISFTQKHFDGGTTTTNVATNVVQSGGNMTACIFSYDGGPSLASTIEFDAYANPFYDLHIFNDPLIWGCQNNVTTAYPDIDPSSPYFTYALTYYSSIGKLATTNRPYNQVNASIRYAWDCQILASVFNPLKAEELGFSPNPSAEGIFRLDNSKAEHYDEIFVSNTEGRILFSLSNVSSSEIILDLSNAKPGMYIATLKNNKGVKVARLVK